MPTQDLFDKPFDDATIAKLEIFEKYVEVWLPVFIHGKFESANICDFFAGAGKDERGTLGSPLRILKVIELFKDQIISNRFQINVLFNDFDSEKLETLKRLIAQNQKSMGGLEEFVKIHFFNEDFKNLFKNLKGNLRKKNNLFFLDQNGVKQILRDVIYELEEFTRTDFMFFISSAFFHRFPFEKCFPDLELDVGDMKQNDIHREILKYYRGMLPDDSETRLYPYSLKKKRNIHGLIFGSKSLLGVEKFLDISWKENTTNGEANFDIDNENPNQMLLPGCEKIKKLDKFKADLEEFGRQKKEFTNRDVLEYTLDGGFPTWAARKYMIGMKKEKLVEHFSHAKIGYKQVFKDNDIITFRFKT